MPLSVEVLTLRERLSETLQRLAPQALLLSGGIDSGLLACLGPELEGFAVSLEGGGGDGPYLEMLRRCLELKVHIVRVSVAEALEALPVVIRILRSFDPALPNDLAVYFGLKAAAERGYRRIATGDGGDELFGGYPYMVELKDLDGYIRQLIPHLQFSSSLLGEHLGVEVVQPYLEEPFLDFALGIPAELKVRQDKGRVWGKWILRKALETLLPAEFAWQQKRPLEVGSGMVALRELIAQEISDEEFQQRASSYGMRFLCKEHIYFYEVFRQVVGEVPPPGPEEERCPNCGGGLPRGRRYCRICGMVSQWPSTTSLTPLR